MIFLTYFKLGWKKSNSFGKLIITIKKAGQEKKYFIKGEATQKIEL